MVSMDRFGTGGRPPAGAKQGAGRATLEPSHDEFAAQLGRPLLHRFEIEQLPEPPLGSRRVESSYPQG